jgi:hypothetical protein
MYDLMEAYIHEFLTLARKASVQFYLSANVTSSERTHTKGWVGLRVTLDAVRKTNISFLDVNRAQILRYSSSSFVSVLTKLSWLFGLELCVLRLPDMVSKFRSTSMFVTFIRAENTKALINQMRLVASGMQRKTCLEKETACCRRGKIIYSTSMLWSSSTQNVTISSLQQDPRSWL